MDWIHRVRDRVTRFLRRNRTESSAGSDSILQQASEFPNKQLAGGTATPSCSTFVDNSVRTSTPFALVAESPSSELTESTSSFITKTEPSVTAHQQLSKGDHQQQCKPSGEIGKRDLDYSPGSDDSLLHLPSSKDDQPPSCLETLKKCGTYDYDTDTGSKDESDNSQSAKKHPVNSDDFHSDNCHESSTPEYTYADPIPQDLVCPICHDALYQVVISDCCGSRFCKLCLDNTELSQGKSCPLCRSKSYRVYPDKFTQRKIDKLKVKCIIEECEWVGELEDLQHHLDQECKWKHIVTLLALSTEQHLSSDIVPVDSIEKSQCASGKALPFNSSCINKKRLVRRKKVCCKRNFMRSKLKPPRKATRPKKMKNRPPLKSPARVLATTEYPPVSLLLPGNTIPPFTKRRTKHPNRAPVVSYPKSTTRHSKKSKSQASKAEQRHPPNTISFCFQTDSISSSHKPLTKIPVRRGKKPSSKKQKSIAREQRQQSRTNPPLARQSFTCSNNVSRGSNDEDNDQHRKRLRRQCEADESTGDIPLSDRDTTSSELLLTCSTAVETPLKDLAPRGRAKERLPLNIPTTNSTHLCFPSCKKAPVHNDKKSTNTSQKSKSQTTTKQPSGSSPPLLNQSSTYSNSGSGGSDDDDHHGKKLKSQCEADQSVSQGEEDTEDDSDPETNELPELDDGSVEDKGSRNLDMSTESNPSVVSGTISTVQEGNHPEGSSRIINQETQTAHLSPQPETPVITQQPKGIAKPGKPLLPDIEAVKAVEALLKESPSQLPEAEQSDAGITPQGSILPPTDRTDLKPSDVAEQHEDPVLSSYKKKQITADSSESQPHGTLPPTHPQSHPSSATHSCEADFEEAVCEANQAGYTSELALHSHIAIGFNEIEEDSYTSQGSTHSTLPSTIKKFHDDAIGSSKLLSRECSAEAKEETSSLNSDANTQSALPPSLYDDTLDTSKLPSCDNSETSPLKCIHQHVIGIQASASPPDSQLTTGVINHPSSEKSLAIPGTFPLQSAEVILHSHGGSLNPSNLVLSNTAVESSSAEPLASCPPVPFTGLTGTEATWTPPEPEMPENPSLAAVDTVPHECTEPPNHNQDWNPLSYLTMPSGTCCSHRRLSEDTAVQLPRASTFFPSLTAELLYGCRWAVEIQPYSHCLQNPPHNGCRLHIFVAICARRSQTLELLELMITLVQSRMIFGKHGTSLTAVFDGHGLWIDSENHSVIVDESCCSLYQSSGSFLCTLRQMIALYRRVWSLFHSSHEVACGGTEIINNIIATLNDRDSSGEVVDEVFLLWLLQNMHHAYTGSLFK